MSEKLDGYNMSEIPENNKKNIEKKREIEDMRNMLITCGVSQELIDRFCGEVSDIIEGTPYGSEIAANRVRNIIPQLLDMEKYSQTRIRGEIYSASNYDSWFGWDHSQAA